MRKYFWKFYMVVFVMLIACGCSVVNTTDGDIIKSIASKIQSAYQDEAVKAEVKNLIATNVLPKFRPQAETMVKKYVSDENIQKKMMSYYDQIIAGEK